MMDGLSTVLSGLNSFATNLLLKNIGGWATFDATQNVGDVHVNKNENETLEMRADEKLLNLTSLYKRSIASKFIAL